MKRLGLLVIGIGIGLAWQAIPRAFSASPPDLFASISMPTQIVRGEFPDAADHLQTVLIRIDNQDYALRLTHFKQVPHTDPDCEGYTYWSFANAR